MGTRWSRRQLLGRVAPRLAISRIHNAAAEIYWPFGPEKVPSRPLRILSVLCVKALRCCPHCLTVNLNREAVGGAVADDVAGGGAGEVGPDDQHRPVGEVAQHALASTAGLVGVAVGQG